jgi:predicted PurR-regulated permease PerM
MSAPARPADFPGIRIVLRTVMVVVAVALTLVLIYLLRQPLTWIFVAAFIAIALSGPINFLQRYMKRGFAVAIVYLLLILTPFALIGLLVPPIVTQANNLVQNLPAYAQDVTEFVNENDQLRQLQDDYDITGKLEEEAAQLPERLGDAAGVLSDIGLGIVNSIFAAVTIIVLSLFMIGSGQRLLHAWARQFPSEREAWLHNLFERIANAIGNYVAGALVQATIAGISAWIMLLILGVDFALPLAVIVFLLDLLPLVGATLGAILVGLVTLFADFPIDTIIWAAFAIIYQQVENNIIQPRIQSRAVQLEPLVVLVSVLFGAALFGVLGALLAIPAAAAIQITIREYMAFRTTQGPPPPAAAKPAPGSSSPGP